jgi:hypothetical protein
MDLTGAAWRKSSRSAGNGGHCVEIARVPVPDGGWCKPVGPAAGLGDCVEPAKPAPPLRDIVAVRDSKDPSGGALAFPAALWQVFSQAVKRGGYDI